VLTPVSAFDLSARAMTKTRLTRLGSARPFVRWINLRTCSEDQASLSRARAGMTDRKSNIGRWFHRITARGGVRPRTPVSPLVPCVAVDPMLAGICLPGTVKAQAEQLRRP
jgi:hypothetical protein